MNSNLTLRIRIIFGSVFLVASIIVIRLSYIQIIKGSIYSEKANKQYVKPSISNFDRGSIFFSSKDGTKIAAASIKESYNLSINPKIIKDPVQVYNALSQYINLDKGLFLDKATRKDDSYEEIQKKIEVSLASTIDALKIVGVNIQKENIRIYPANTLSSDIIGILGLDKENKLAGRYGLESFYENILSRENSDSDINFFAELFSSFKNIGINNKNREGDIITSIEPTVESYLEKILSDTILKWKSDSIGGIIMDPNTGQIYAMAELPTFNPNDLSNIKDASIFSNGLVENSYEMGSIIKPLTIASAIDSGAINQKYTYDDMGFLILNGKKISNFDGKARGPNTTVQKILSESLNVGAANISLKMGLESFSKYFLSFGFGEKTGIDEPNEQKGIIKNLITGRDVEIANISFGQGISMTPIQAIRALSVLANGGKMVFPHIVKTIEYQDGTIVDIKTPKSIQVIKKESVDAVTEMLIHVVDKDLKKGLVKMDRYSIAAKTGTAQIADPTKGGYYKDRYLHSFFGYFPAYNPKFIIFLYHIYPKGSDISSVTLTDPFIQLTKLLINYYEIPPDR